MINLSKYHIRLITRCCGGHVISAKITVTSLASSSPGSRRWGTGSALTSSKPSHTFPGAATRRSPPPPGVPVLGAVVVSLGVRVGIYQRSEEELEESDDAPEEVCDGVEAPGLGLKDPAVRGNVDHGTGATLLCFI